MKVIILTLLVCLTLTAYTSEDWTGAYQLFTSLCDFEAMDGCAIQVNIMYSTDLWTDTTMWFDEDAGLDKKLEKWEDEERLTLLFTISGEEDDTLVAPTDADDYIRCLACLNVDENGDLRNGDKGFAACWKIYEGDLTEETEWNYKPEWHFLDSIKVTNKGNNIKATGDEGWESEYTWGKINECDNTWTEDRFYVSSWHDDDSIGLVSKDGFKGTGLNNGENHLKCYYTSGYHQISSETKEAKDWEPSIDSDDGESLVGWISTGVPQVIHLKNAHKWPVSTWSDSAIWQSSCA